MPSPYSRPNQAPDPLSLSAPQAAPTPSLFISAAKLSERNGQADVARGHFQQALSLAPNNVEALLGLARLEDRQENLVAAERLYRTAVSKNPHNPTSLNDLALCLARQGNLHEATRLLQQATEIQPDKRLYRNNLATVLVEQKRDHEALAHLTAVHGPAAGNYNLGHLLAKRGRSKDARPYFAAALEIDPQMEAAKTALAALDSGNTAEVRVSAAPASRCGSRRRAPWSGSERRRSANGSTPN